jgi:hypothetical protein
MNDHDLAELVAELAGDVDKTTPTKEDLAEIYRWLLEAEETKLLAVD